MIWTSLHSHLKHNLPQNTRILIHGTTIIIIIFIIMLMDVLVDTLSTPRPVDFLLVKNETSHIGAISFHSHLPKHFLDYNIVIIETCPKTSDLITIRTTIACKAEMQALSCQICSNRIMLRLDHRGLCQCRHTVTFKYNEKLESVFVMFRNSMIYKVTLFKKKEIVLCLTRFVMYERPLFFLKPYGGRKWERGKKVWYSSILIS